MAKSLTNIQTAVRFNAMDNGLVLTTGEGLVVFNRIYRNFVGAFPWGEYTQTPILSTKTVADQPIYTWAGAETIPEFAQILSVEIESPAYDSSLFGEAVFGVDDFGSVAVGDTWKRIPETRDEFDWNLMGRKDSEAVPRYYRKRRFNRHYIVAADYGDETNRWHDLDGDGTWTQTTSSHLGVPVRKYAATVDDGTGATTVTDATSIEFRPAPSTADQRIRIRGVIEPTEFTAGEDETLFLQATADDALERLVAASYLMHDATGDYASIQIEGATRALKQIWGTHAVTPELVRGII